MAIELYDTHAHLDDDQLLGQVDVVIQEAAAAGVRTILTVGTTGASSRQCVALADRFEGVFAAVGIQPNYTSAATEEDWRQVVALADHERVRAIGETGLDTYWDYAPLALQQEYFARHLQLAQDVGLPFVVHMRDCEQALLAALVAASHRGPLRGVMHSFSGSAEMAQECVRLGLHISFAGMVTFKKAGALRDVARLVPAERLLLETDAPYLTPHPHRGRRPNQPALLIHTAGCLADVRGVGIDELAAVTTDNARALFRRQ